MQSPEKAKVIEKNASGSKLSFLLIMRLICFRAMGFALHTLYRNQGSHLKWKMNQFLLSTEDRMWPKIVFFVVNRMKTFVQFSNVVDYRRKAATSFFTELRFAILECFPSMCSFRFSFLCDICAAPHLQH